MLDRGAGQHAWQDHDTASELLAEVAAMINTKPTEPWLIVHHGKACGGQFEQRLRERLPKGCSNLSFLPWGQHQGTNNYADITNVILAGTTFYPESEYEGLSYLSADQLMTGEVPKRLVDDVRLGEHCHHILQALCRASVRGSDGPSCKTCNAYIIASKGSGIRKSLPDIFPGCRVKDWKPKHKRLRGKVLKAVAYLERAHRDHRSKVILFSDLMEYLAIPNKSNFNKTIRKHPDFKDALDRLGMQEVSTDGSCHLNAIASASSFGPLPGASYSVQ